MKRSFTAVAAAILVALTFSSAPAAATAAPSTATARSDGLGPYAVGRETFEVVDPTRAGRALPVDVWYPADPVEAAGAPASTYDLLLADIESEVAKADVSVLDAGPFPLVVFSHGSGGVRYQSYFLTEALASRGFVVVAPDHVGNTTFDSLFDTSAPFAQVAVDRPLDVSLVISRMLERSADPADDFSGRVDGDRIGVAGHSFGGFIALASASGYADVPADPRVDAIVPIAPASGILDDARLRSIEIPTLVIGGTKDTTTPILDNSTRPFDLVAARQLYRVDVIGAGHASFTNICDFYETLVAAGIPADLLAFLQQNFDDGCAPDLIAIDEAQRLTTLYTTSFFQRFLHGDLGAIRTLNRAAARAEPDVVFLRRSGRAGSVVGAAGR